MRNAPLALGLAALVASPALASDLKLNGAASASAAIGSTVQLDLTGNPGLPALLAIDATPGPVSLFGESLALGFTSSLTIVGAGVTGAGGVFTQSAPVPNDLGLVGVVVYALGVVVDGADPNGLDFSNGADLTVQAPGTGWTSMELAGNALFRRPYFQYVRAFNQGSPVEVAVDTTLHPGLVGQSGAIHVVAAKSAAQWDANPALVDVSSGGAEPWTFVAGGVTANTVTVDTGTLNGLDGAELGVGYDVVVDLDGDGKLSSGDLIDGYGDRAGLYAVHDLTQPGPYAVVETIYSGGTWLGQDLYYPANIASLGKVPVIIISHGNGHNYQWYDHIGYHMASYGYVVMSHQNNTQPGIETASTTTLTNTDNLLGNLATIAGGVLNGHVDSHAIVWLGHSRGGEGVARAYDRLVDGTYVANSFTAADIQLVSSIAPTDFLGTASANPHGVPYHLWVGQADADVSGCANNDIGQSFHLLDRAENQRQSISLQGVGHAWFHNGGGNPWATGPCQIGQVSTHAIMRGYFLPLVKYHLEGNVPAKDYLTRQYEAFHPIGAPVADPCVVVDLQFREAAESGKFVIDDYQTSTLPSRASSGAGVTWTAPILGEGRLDDGDAAFTNNPGDPFNGFTQGKASDTTRGMYTECDGLGDYSITWNLLPVDEDWTGFVDLSFRGAQATRHPLTTATLGDTTFEVELVDGAGHTSRVSIAAFGGGLEEPYQRTSCGIGTGWGNEFETIRIPLAAFREGDATFDLSSVDKLRILIGPSHGSAGGRLGFDDFELTTD